MINIIIQLIIISNIISQSCDLKKAAIQFASKEMLNDDFDDSYDPYVTLNKQDRKKINEVLKDRERVCAIQFVDEDKQKYILKDFQSKDDAEKNGFMISHYGKCGFCSNLQNLAVYLNKDLTKPSKRCTYLDFFSRKAAQKCFVKKIGFTKKCAKIWNDSAVNTKKKCLGICLWTIITLQPDVKDGKLNKCILCDENKSGPLFKYFAGRNRRNSGIKSELPRPDDEIRPVDHCAYYQKELV